MGYCGACSSAGGTGYACGAACRTGGGSSGYSASVVSAPVVTYQGGLESKVSASYISNNTGSGNVNYSIADTSRQMSIPDRGFYDLNDFLGIGYRQDEYRAMSNPLTQTRNEYIVDFLNPDRDIGPFVGSAAEIKELIEETFFAVTEERFPEDIIVRLVDDKEMKDKGEGVMGFALNRKHLGKRSEVFVKKDELAKVMLVLGHEIGHALTKQLPNSINEEAKAFAFEIAWMRRIRDLNIGGLGSSIKGVNPANNGIHNVALKFVLDTMKKEGISALEMFRRINTGEFNASLQ